MKLAMFLSVRRRCFRILPSPKGTLRMRPFAISTRNVLRLMPRIFAASAGVCVRSIVIGHMPPIVSF